MRDERAVSERDSTKKETERSGLRSVLGLGLIGAEVDLEKGEETVAVMSIKEVGEELMPGGCKKIVSC